MVETERVSDLVAAHNERNIVDWSAEDASWPLDVGCRVSGIKRIPSALGPRLLKLKSETVDRHPTSGTINHHHMQYTENVNI